MSKEQKPYSDAEWQEMKKMREQGAKFSEIAQMFGRTEGAVSMKFYSEAKKQKVSEGGGRTPVDTVTAHDPAMFRGENANVHQVGKIDFIALQYYLWQKFKSCRGGQNADGIIGIALCPIASNCEVNLMFSDGTAQNFTICPQDGLYFIADFANAINMALAKKQYKKPVQNASVLAKAKTLNDFTPRQIIKHLHDIGFRIEDGELVLIEKKKINIHSILTEE
jgi:hypothetical protein